MNKGNLLEEEGKIQKEIKENMEDKKHKKRLMKN